MKMKREGQRGGKRARVKDIKTERGTESWRGWEKDRDEERRAEMRREGQR